MRPGKKMRKCLAPSPSLHVCCGGLKAAHQEGAMPDGGRVLSCGASHSGSRRRGRWAWMCIGPRRQRARCRDQPRETLLAVGTSVVKLSLQSGRGDIPAALARWDPVKLNRLCPDQVAYRHRNHNSQLVVTDRLVPARALYLSSQEGRFLTASSQ